MQFTVTQSSWGHGDIVCAFWTVAGLRQTYPDAHIYLRARAERKRTAELCADADKVLCLDDAAIGFNRDVFHTYQEEVRQNRQSLPRAVLYSQQFEVMPVKPKLAVSPEDIATAEKLLKDVRNEGPLVFLAPFCVWSARCWPLPKWHELERQLKMQGFVTIILGELLSNELKSFRGIYWWGFRLGVLLHAISYAAAVIANDSLIMHLAGLTETKTFAVLGPSAPEIVNSHMQNIINIRSDLYCTSCHFDPKCFVSACSFGCRSLFELSVEKVFGAVVDKLALPAIVTSSNDAKKS